MNLVMQIMLTALLCFIAGLHKIREYRITRKGDVEKMHIVREFRESGFSYIVAGGIFFIIGSVITILFFIYSK